MKNSRHIPGFYYDKDKNRYFKIDSNHPAPHSKQPNNTKQAPLVNEKLTTFSNLNWLPKILARQQSGQHLKDQYVIRQISNLMLSKLSCISKKTLPLANYDDSDEIMLSPKCMEVSNDGSLLAVASDMRGTLETLISIYNINQSTASEYDHTCTNQFKSMCWQPNGHALLTMNQGKSRHCYVRRHTFFGNGCSERLAFRPKTFYNCAKWIKGRHCETILVYGGNGNVYLSYDLTPDATCIRINTCSDVLAVDGCNHGAVVLCGCRNGNIHVVDVRTKRSQLTINNTKMKGIETLKVLNNDDSYCLASSMDGKIQLFDIRLCKDVFSYYGHVNSHHQLGFSISNDDEFICAAGEDRSVRLWSARQQKPLHCLPFDESSNTNLVSAAACFSQCSIRPIPHIFCAVNNQLRTYDTRLITSLLRS